MTAPPPGTAALVLAGGGARGAFEAGVIRYLRDEVPGGDRLRLPIICGTSVGAINAVYLAATADRPIDAAREMTEIWSGLHLGDVFLLGMREVLSARKRLSGRPDHRHPPLARGGIVDARPLERLVRERVPWKQLRANIDSGLVEALTVSVTHVATGHCVVFVDTAREALPPWTRDPHSSAKRARIGLPHTLASACIPLVFPAIAVGGQYYVDGGLRQNTPLSPALRLGADRVLVVGSRHRPSGETDVVDLGRLRQFPGAWFLAGKMLNALLIDRIDYDLTRLEGFNRLLDTLSENCSADVMERVAETIGKLRGQPYRRVSALHIRPSRNIGAVAARVAASKEFRERTRGLAARLARRIAKSQLKSEADILSYFLFDGVFAQKLVEMGWEDARRHHDELARFVEGQTPPVAVAVPRGA